MTTRYLISSRFLSRLAAPPTLHPLRTNTLNTLQDCKSACQHYTATSSNFSLHKIYHVLSDTNMKTLSITSFASPSTLLTVRTSLTRCVPIVQGFGTFFPAKRKLAILLFGRCLSETQGISIAHHLHTFIAHSQRYNIDK